VIVFYLRVVIISTARIEHTINVTRLFWFILSYLRRNISDTKMSAVEAQL
jgi:hypothetical protein